MQDKQKQTCNNERQSLIIIIMKWYNILDGY